MNTPKLRVENTARVVYRSTGLAADAAQRRIIQDLGFEPAGIDIQSRLGEILAEESSARRAAHNKRFFELRSAWNDQPRYLTWQAAISDAGLYVAAELWQRTDERILAEATVNLPREVQLKAREAPGLAYAYPGASDSLVDQLLARMGSARGPDRDCMTYRPRLSLHRG